MVRDLGGIFSNTFIDHECTLVSIAWAVRTGLMFYLVVAICRAMSIVVGQTLISALYHE